MSEIGSNGFLKWYGNVERMNEERKTKFMCKLDVDSRRNTGRFSLMMLERVIKSFKARLLDLRVA